MSLDETNLSKSASYLIHVFEGIEKEKDDDKITVNQLVSKIASFYEKFRTAMDYGSEETIPRRAIERMLNRMLFLEGDPKSLAQDLLREMVWAGYLPNAAIPESIINEVSASITSHLELKKRLSQKKIISKDELNEFTLQILSCEILQILIPNKTKNAVANFMFKNLKDTVVIDDDSEQTKDIQVYIAIRKVFGGDDTALLRYRLFREIFGKITNENIESISDNFEKGYKEIKHELNYPKKEKIVNHIKKKNPPFSILYDILNQEKGNMRAIVKDDEVFKDLVFEVCNLRYSTVRKKVQTAIIRSFIFILFTKSVLALTIEGSFETIFLGSIQWKSIILNTALPPLIMVAVGIGIRTPGKENSEAIYRDIQKLLKDEEPELIHKINIKLKNANKKNLSDYIFSSLWFLSIFGTFGMIWYVLGLLDFNILSKGIFVFFIAIISFLSYRIYQTAHMYTVTKKQNIFTPFFDFLFIPIVRVGRSLTEGISQINFLLIVIDFIIETPFKGTIGFFEQWFLFAAKKREELE